MNVLDKMIDILIAAVLMFILPVSYYAIKTDSMIQVNVEKETSEFIERIATQGYITRDMYEKYLSDINNTGKPYTIQLLREQYALEPEYKFRKAGEIIEEDEEKWDGVNEYLPEPVHTEIPLIEDPILNTGNHNTETNDSIMANAKDTPASPTHIHNQDCFGEGSRNTKVYADVMDSNYYYSGYGTQFIHSVSVYCAECGKEIFSVREYDYGRGGTSYRAGSIQTNYYNYDKNGNIVYQTYSFSYMEKKHPVENYYKMMKKGSDIYYYALSHPYTLTYRNDYQYEYRTSEFYWDYEIPAWTNKKTGDNYELVEGTLPFIGCVHCQAGKYLCNQLIISITPTHPVQTIYPDENLITTAVATFLDGSTKTVVCNTVFDKSRIGLKQEASLSYETEVNGKKDTFHCSIYVDVVSRCKTCSHGHTYNLKPDGTDPGCPYCRGWLKNLGILIPSSGRMTMYRNEKGSLEEEGVGLIATYLDGHVEYVYSGYKDNLVPNYVGKQTVTIGYQGLTTTLEVEVLRNRRKCDICGLSYNLNPDDSDPGCPYCKAKVPVFTGNVMKYCKHTYQEEILKELYEGSGIYYFRRGDRVIVNTESKRRLAGSTILNNLFRLQIRVSGSETIKDEAVKTYDHDRHSDD